MLSSLIMVRDSFANFLSGIGAANPKQAANTYTSAGANPIEVENAFRTSTWFGKIVDIPADDATRMGRQWIATKEQITAIEAEEKRLGYFLKVRQAMKWKALYGGAGILIGVPGMLNQPLDVTRIGKNSIQFLTVLPRGRLPGQGRDTSPTSPNFGLPEFYRVGNETVHPSRVIRFSGPMTETAMQTGDGWGDSIYDRLQDAVTNADLGASTIGALLLEAKKDIYKIKDLMSQMGNDQYTELLIKRFKSVQLAASVTGATLLDGTDEFEQKQITWTGLPDAVRLLLVIVSGAADIPVTRLLMTSASGLNATGEGDLKNYYDNVKAKQELDLTPELAPLDEMLIRSALGSRPPSIWYAWRPLWQPTMKEQADTNKTNAEADMIYSNSALIPQDALAAAVQTRMIDSGNYPGLEEALKKSDGELLKPDPKSDDLDADEDDDGDANKATDAAPQPLYVRRDVVNKSEITAWAKSQGFTDIRNDLHVTLIYSTTPVDWMKAGKDWGENENGLLTISAGGPRMVEALGQNGEYKALTFAASHLSWRHEEIKRETGASYDWDYYQPHITISRGDMPPNVEPYRGKIVLGPEIFERIKG